MTTFRLLLVIGLVAGCGDDDGPRYLPIGDTGPEPSRDAAPNMDAPAPPDSGRPPRDAAGLPSILGTITEAPGGAAIAGARVTLVNAAGAFVDEVRSAADGSYEIIGVDAGDYRVGASALDRAFVDQAATV